MPAEPSFTVEGNRLRLMTEGPARLDELVRLIAGAQRTLRIVYYIYVDDEVGTIVRQAMIDAAGRGVAVSLIVDGLGSEHAAAQQFFQPLGDAGIHVCRFVPRWGRRYLLRNHQKLALADETRAIIGGFNVKDSYFGTVHDQAWRDLGLMLEGPAAARLADYFDALSSWASRDHAGLRALNRAIARFSETEGRARWLLGGPTRRLSPWARSVRQDMRAGRRIGIIAGYFAPSPTMLRRLDRTGLTGEVTIVLPAKNDHAPAIWASRFTYAGLLRKGVKIFEYQPTKLHTKLFVIDDIVYIGSANFDVRSLFINLEIMLRIDDPAFADHARSYLMGEVAQSERITPELNRARSGPWTRIKQAVAYFVMAVLDPGLTRRLNVVPGRRTPPK